MDYQVIIHINSRPILFHTAEDLATYVDQQRKVAPKWYEYSDLPLLKVVDDTTAEEFTFVDSAHLPKETLTNQGGNNLLIIENGS